MEQNFVMGAGKIYIALIVAGVAVHERYVGDTPGFSTTVETETVQKWSSDGPTAELLDEASIRVTRDFTLQIDNVNDDNLALFYQADIATISQSAGSVTAEPITGVKQGYYYQLGQDANNATGVRDVTSVVVKDAVPTTYVEGTDYTVDLALARIYIVPGGGIVDGTDLLVDYDTNASSRIQLAAHNRGPVNVALRYVADNTRGENRDLYGPSTLLRADGELPFKSRDTWQQLQLRGSFRVPASGSALYIDGRAVA